MARPRRLIPFERQFEIPVRELFSNGEFEQRVGAMIPAGATDIQVRYENEYGVLVGHVRGFVLERQRTLLNRHASRQTRLLPRFMR